MKSKKAVGLSIGFIIVAIIALAVLFVVIAIFMNVTGKTAENIGNCETKGGRCLSECTSYRPIKIFVSGDCEGTDNLCCLRATDTDLDYGGGGGGGPGWP
tara:strand:+ start:4644 stop:4943 length:300 start_codon:yes stop_codon:yes gene_type:complete